MTALDAVDRLKGIKERLLDPVPFYVEHLGSWRTLARQVAVEVLSVLKPEGSDPEVWAAGVQTAAERISTQLLVGEVGALIFMAAAPPEALPDDPRFYQVGGIPVSDIERWVRESREGTLQEGVAKRLGPIDEGKSDLQVAWRILYALKLGKTGSPGLEAAIRKFLGAASTGAMDHLLPNVVTAWFEHFTVRARADWQLWVAAQIR